MKRGFTLIELIVVIGIIGLLAGVMLTTFGGATESARATKCLANLKSLATAANAYAMKKGYYPLAGSIESLKIISNKKAYCETPGWISWLSCDGQFGVTTAGSHESGSADSSINYPTSYQSVNICPYFGTGDSKKDDWALQNGSLWASVGRNRSVYTCPTHVKNRSSDPLFSYVMNGYFGYDISRGSRPMASVLTVAKAMGSIEQADRVLMFADINADDSGSEGGATDPKNDAVLNYKATVNGKSYGAEWEGEPESIGFPHTGKKTRSSRMSFLPTGILKSSCGRQAGP